MNAPDAIKSLSPTEIADLKHWLYDNPQAIGRICTRLAVEEVETLHGTDLKKSFAYSLVDEVGAAVIKNYKAIQGALAAPTDEWPKDVAIRPEQVSQEMESIVVMERNG